MAGKGIRPRVTYCNGDELVVTCNVVIEWMDDRHVVLKINK